MSVILQDLVHKNGFSINVPCSQKTFNFIARNSQEKEKWTSVLSAIEEANKIQIQIDKVQIFA